MKKYFLMMMAIFAINLQGVNAQTKIVSGHPDFKVKVSRCVASGKSVIMDLIFQNIGANDVQDVTVIGSYNGASEAYDSEGNIYKNNDSDIEIKVANASGYDCHESGRFYLPTDVPIKCSVRINGVPENAESIARLILIVNCPAWSLGWENRVKISNVPISRY